MISSRIQQVWPHDYQALERRNASVGNVTDPIGGYHVMVVDDDRNQRLLYTRLLERAGLHVECFPSGEAFLEGLTQLLPDAVCLDLHMPGLHGLETLKRLREHNPHLPVIILTADFDPDQIVAAMQQGAYDYQVKPIDRTRLVTTVRNAVEKGRLQLRVASLERELGTTTYDRIVGESSGMADLFRQMDRVAASDINVLIHGESGTGKELVARALHEGSGWKTGPFVAVNCAAIPESLQESELFGHEKGAFTGAMERRIGRFEEASGGTLFLDEVAELSPGLQAKLLRVLQERVVRRVGGREDVACDFRLLAATHRRLADEVAAGDFREDLYYRIAVFDLDVPPLRDRPGDVLVLARFFLDQWARQGEDPLEITEEAVRLLERHAWPGNVRELENALRRATVLAQDGEIRPQDLPSGLSVPVTGRSQPGSPDLIGPEVETGDIGEIEAVPSPLPLAAPFGPQSIEQKTLAEIEERAIEAALARSGSNLSKVARELGIGRTTLYRKLDKYGLVSDESE